MISKSTIVLSLLSLLPHIHAQTLSCDGSVSATSTNVAAGGSATFDLAPGIATLLSYSGCGSTVSHSMQLFQSPGDVLIDSCPEDDAGCTSRCVISITDDTFTGFIEITNEDPVAAGDLTVTIECNVTTTLAPSMTPSMSPSVTPSISPSVTPSVTPSISPSVTPSATPTQSPITPTPTTTTTSAVTPTTESPTMALSSTMETDSTDSLSFSSDSDDSDDEIISGSGSDESGSDDASDIVSLDESGVSDESDDSAETQGGGRTNNVFEAQGQNGDAGTQNMVWTYMWGIVAMFGAINVAICYCMLKNRNYIKRGQVSFQKVENSVDVQDVI